VLNERLVAAGKTEEEALEVLTTFVPAFASKLDSSSDGQKTAVLLYLSEPEIEDVVGTLLENWEELGDEKTMDSLVRALVRAHQGQTSAPDIALFGRMLAEKPALNIDAACQVAHAISTHRVTMEMDFYTAVDDLKPDDTAGAGMMGFIGFDSPCFYRYARIDWHKLVENLNDDVELARRSVEGFLRAVVEAVPTGKQTSFAAHNPPDLLLAVVRGDGMGWSLANAFERPVRPEREGGLVGPSVAALDAYWGNLCRAYGSSTLACTAVVALDPELSLANLEGARVEDVGAWTGAVLGALPA